MEHVKIAKGMKLKHFKGHVIEILEIGKHSETLEDMVVYKHLGTDEIWIRPLNMFYDKVDKEKYPEVLQEYRFEEVRE